MKHVLNKRKGIQNIYTSLFCMSLFLLSTLYGIKLIYVFAINKNITEIIDYIERIIYAWIIVLIIFRNRYNKREILLALIVGSILFAIYIISRFAALFKAFVLIIGAKNQSKKQILDTVLFSYTLIILLSLFLYITGVSNAGIQRRGYNSFGFITANMWGLFIFVGCQCILLKNKTMRYKFSVSWTAALIIMVLVNNRSIAILLFIYPIVESVISVMIKRKPFFISLIVYAFPVCCLLVSFVLAMYYPSNSLIQKINSITSNRIFLNYYNITKYGIHLFGKGVLFVSGDRIYNPVTGMYSTYNTVDNSYVCLVLQMGCIATVVYIFGYYLITKKAIKQTDISLLSIIIIVSLLGMAESSILEIYNNIPLLLLLTKNYGSEKTSLQTKSNI